MAGRPATLKIDIVTDLNSKGLNQADDSLARLNRSATVAAGAIGVGLAAGAVKAVKAASDLSESTNAVNVVFGDASGKVLDFGKNSAEAVGLSSAAFQTLATSTGSLLQNFGYSADQAAESSITLATRAADMASVFNTDVDTALAAVNAGLRGETEPLRQFGVNLNDASLKAQAMAMGLYDGTGALDANTKALAAEALILEQTSALQGDFANTSDGLANSQRILAADVENLAAQFGEALLPVAEQMVEALSGLATWIGENQGLVMALVAAVAVLTATILTVNAALKAYQAMLVIVSAAQKVWNAVTKLSTKLKLADKAVSIALTAAGYALIAMQKAATIAQRALNLAMRLNPIGLVITAIMLLVGGLVLAYKKSETFRKIVDKLWAILKGAVVGAFNAVSSAISSVVGWLKSAWQWVSNLISKVRDLLGSGLGKVGDLLGFGRSAATVSVASVPTARAAPGIAATSQRTGGTPGARQSLTVTVNGASNPQATARELAAILTGAQVRTGYLGLRG